MTKIGLYNLKGGVGKTAAAVNLAYLAAADGLKTLLWDMDPQGSASFYFNAVSQIKNESSKLIVGGVDIKEVIQETLFENLSIITADMSARNADILLDDAKQSKKKIKNLLRDLKQFDLIFLDCPPGISLLHENVFNAVDVVLMPNIPTTLSIRSHEKVVDYFRENNMDTSKIRCFFNMVDHRKSLHHETINEFYNKRLFLKNYIPYLSDVEKMGTHQQPIFEFANGSYAAQCYRDMWNEVKKTCL